jgi:hypothetical protein
MTLSRREFLALIGSTAIGAGALWPPRSVEARARSLENLAQNIQSGGPPKNWILPIDRPKYVAAAETEKFLQANDIVCGIERRDHHEF